MIDEICKKKRSSAEQFTHDLPLITGDIEKALRAFYIQKFIDEAAMEDETLVQVLNRRALLWNVQVNSLQTTVFMTLGRVFDHSAHSIQKVMDGALAHPELFLRDALYAPASVLVRSRIGWMRLWPPLTSPRQKRCRLLEHN